MVLIIIKIAFIDFEHYNVDKYIYWSYKSHKYTYKDDKIITADEISDKVTVK